MTILGGRFYTLRCSFSPSVPWYRRVGLHLSRNVCALTVGNRQYGFWPRGTAL